MDLAICPGFYFAGLNDADDKADCNEIRWLRLIVLHKIYLT